MIATDAKLTARETIELEDRYGAHNYHPLDVVITRGEGCWVWDVEGNRYLDFLAAYSAVNQGHCHPRIVRALVEQAGRLALTSRAFRNDRLGELYREVCELAGYPKFLPMNTGAEAVETAIKAARRWAYTVKGVPDGEAEILVFENNFHGRTTTIVGFSTEEGSRAGFGPFTPGFTILPYGDAAAVERALAERGRRIAAILVEPIQGEAGIVVPPEGYLGRLRELADEHRTLLVADEIQSGLGRTGKLFAFEHEGIRPDVVIVGKALSGGLYPVSGILATEEVMGVFDPGSHGSTYGGNPLGAAVAVEALRVIVEERLPERSAELGAYALERLRRLDSPHVKEVRGRGLWIGIELHPEAGGARRFCEALQREGVLAKETHKHVIRMAPPLVIAREDLDWSLERIERVLAAA
ncbi:MAG TPA: ornithine--oxo-acid transaminase [Thermoanaerobaculia bacterium]|nr:ornithine--oxo-acid transaminase [Thermoanaerobaculia bacterium]